MKDYFAFYQIPERFYIDEKALKTKFFQLSREYHPDFHIGNEAKYEEALDTTALNNTAYKTLSTFDNRLKYILEKNGVLKESQNAIPQEFLMEMMEVNEAIMELQMDFDAVEFARVNKEVEAMEDELHTAVEAHAKQADKLIDSGAEWQAELQNITKLYLKIKYVLRIRETLNTFAA